jgi:hypothetical protein
MFIVYFIQKLPLYYIKNEFYILDSTLVTIMS